MKFKFAFCEQCDQTERAIFEKYSIQAKFLSKITQIFNNFLLFLYKISKYFYKLMRNDFQLVVSDRIWTHDSCNQQTIEQIIKISYLANCINVKWINIHYQYLGSV